MDTQRLTVDGEVFVVRKAEPGHYHYDWVSGRNPGYGFTSATSTGSPLTPEQHVESIREFLAAVDPTTGYIEDDDEADD